MILQEGKLGDAQLAFVRNPTLRTRVRFAQPLTRAKVLLRGFDIGFAGGDKHLQDLRVRLDLGYGDDPSEVEVIAGLVLEDHEPTGELISVEVWFTIIGE